MVCYIALYDTIMIEQVSKVTGQCTTGANLFVAVNMNVGIGYLEGNARDKGIFEALDVSGLEDISEHFLPHQYFQWDRYGRT